MVGCLGGLGRSLTKWMYTCGARKFTFFSRSGVDRPAAKEQVTSLKKLGAQVHVIRGDIGSPKDVKRAIEQVQDPIGGVIRAAMAVNVSITPKTL